MIRQQLKALIAAAALMLSGQMVFAKTHARTAGYKVMAEVSLGGETTTDMFLREDQHGHKFLYVASAGGTLAVLDVSNLSNPHKVTELRLTGGESGFRVEPVNNRIAIATNVEDSTKELALVDLGNGPSAAVALRLKNAEAYALDGANNTVYVATAGKLVVMLFEHPVTREAEIWEQWYNNR